METSQSPSSSAQSSCWSNIVKNPPQQPNNQNPSPNPTNQIFVESCKSSKGISMAVIDANAVIEGGEKLHNLADKFVTVPEVLAEIRDPVSRHRLSFVPFTIDSLEPSTDALNKVIKFARATGDLQTLSDVDLKLLALTYTLEAQIHGTKHIRDAPPPIHTVNVKRLPEKDMPGWGSNVPNLEEWEALEQEAGDGLNAGSRILPLKEMSLNTITVDDQSEDCAVVTGSEEHSENHEDVDHGLRKHRRYPPKKKEISIEGKKMVADGIDASQGQFDDDAGDWMPAVSRSTHRRFLRRKARREYNEALIEKDSRENMESNDIKEITIPDPSLHQSSESVNAGNGIYEESEMKNNDEDLSSILTKMRLEEESAKALQEGKEENSTSVGLKFTDNMHLEASADSNANVDLEANIANGELDHLDILSETTETVDVSHGDDDASEQSWMLRSLSESSVACVTSDYAMQNVLLQMGLRLLAPGGMQIRQLHRWILKCHACYTVTAEIGRIFCPKCGNGGTLRKVAITVGENGIVLADCRPRISLRGTKFSLPLPQGGRDAITKNLILREDQLPQKLLYPKTKKKVNKQGDDFFAVDDIFSHHTDKRAPFRPPIRKALAVFSGRRNPNDNHYSRPKN
ncbi:RNA-binding protein nob1, putative [Ricinus communis]|uniref:RNA-binding protein nob1, putative n=1 Tax=Ricinus communis TaxID=3988 RepID=B9RC94_RICCO|nr:RNA-binding protein nob1, putative [Ricinus communis]|eukprot:XP_002509778.1 RNA-binding protein NOB1 [Ricinus communis]